MLPLRNKYLKSCFCAFCRSPRQVNQQRHVGLREFGVSVLGAVLLSFLFFQSLEARAVVFFGILLSLFEFFVQIKYRLGLTCPHCGFDPLLYMKSKEKACAQVQARLKNRREDPLVLMSSRAKLNLPFLMKKKESFDAIGQVRIRPKHVANNLDLKL